jgi:hypothetical protein
MQWPNGKQWTPKPSAKLCAILAVLKPRKGELPLGPMERRVAALEKRFLGKLRVKGDCVQHHSYFSGEGYSGICVGKTNFKAHRFAWLLYRGEIPKGLYVCHACDNRLCVNLDHLWLGTAKDNMVDASQKKRLWSPSGEKSWQAKLTAERVKLLRRLHKEGKLNQTEWARKWGITSSSIGQAVHGRTWRHVK